MAHPVKQPGSAPERPPLFNGTRHHPRCTHVKEAVRTLAQRPLLTNLFALAAALRFLEQARVTALPAQHRVPAQYDANSSAPPRAQHALTSVVAATHLAATASARLTGSRPARFPIRPFLPLAAVPVNSTLRLRPLERAPALEPFVT